jgi:hypothetical protein
MSMCFAVYFKAQEERVEKLGRFRNHNKVNTRGTDLVVVGCAYEDDRSFFGNMVGTTRTHFSKEYLSDCPPEEHCSVIAKMCFLGHGEGR